MIKVKVLGTEYDVEFRNRGEDPCLDSADGYCDPTMRICVVDNSASDTFSFGDLESYKRKVLRHELIHAFLYESGLVSESWGTNEEIVDWIAWQFPKLQRAFIETGAL